MADLIIHECHWEVPCSIPKLHHSVPPSYHINIPGVTWASGSEDRKIGIAQNWTFKRSEKVTFSDLLTLFPIF